MGKNVLPLKKEASLEREGAVTSLEIRHGWVLPS